MLIGYSSFLRKLAMDTDSVKGLTGASMAYRLNLRHDELSDLLIIMQRKGDIELVAGNDMKYNYMGKDHFNTEYGQGSRADYRFMLYRLTEKGRNLCK